MSTTTPTRPPFDPELLAFLATQPAKPKRNPPIPARRAGLKATEPTLDGLIAGSGLVCTVETVPGPDGAPDVPLSIIRDLERAGSGPILYVTHGGGMWAGDPATSAPNWLRWVRGIGATAVAVDYRLAPEHPFPAGVDDCYAGLVWTSQHAEDLGGDPSRLIVYGGSAGGGLTAAITLMARDRGGPAILGQLLVAPMLDDRVDTVSAKQFAETPAPWSGTDDVEGWTALLGDARGTGGVSPYAAPAREQDLSGLPPTYIEVGSAEVFRDEDVAYASRIWACGGSAELHVWPGVFHYFDADQNAAITREAREARLDWLRRLLAAS